jgi:L-ascorbate metabolism protein UlaG (beta-lactamase superfamily)
VNREGFHHVGNSTHWIVLEGVHILTDPWVTEPADHILAHTHPPRPLPTRPDVVLITHRHGDHFDLPALSTVDRAAAVVVAAGEMAEALSDLGFAEVHGVEPGDVLPDVRGLAVEVVRGRHSVPEVCFRVERHGRAFFFGGDTMVTPEIEAMAAARPVPFAILPGERSTLLGRRFVMTPEEAVSLARRLGAARAVLTHHEQFVARRWPYGWMVSIPPVGQLDFPEWFLVPRPGDFVAFPWPVAQQEAVS